MCTSRRGIVLSTNNCPHKKENGIDDEARCADDDQIDFDSNDDKI